MSTGLHSHCIVIAGASSLLGAELKSLLEESRFAACDFQLIDEDLAAGTLTEVGGEPTVIQPVEEGSFDRAKFIFFTGSSQFTAANIAAARATKAKIIDLSGALAEGISREYSDATVWYPSLEALRSEKVLLNTDAYAIPSATAITASALTLALATLEGKQLTFLAFQSVSEAGRAGVEELESQTSHLLSFQNIGKEVFDTQVAFTLLDRFGPASRHNLNTVRNRVRSELKAILGEKNILPSLQILHAPVFYGATFAACAQLAPTATPDAIAAACKLAGFSIASAEDAPGSISVAGESTLQLSPPEPDPLTPGFWWFWGAADNIRIPASYAIQLADKLLS